MLGYVSRDVFYGARRAFGKQHKRPMRVWPIETYDHSGPALDALNGGGDLFLFIATPTTIRVDVMLVAKLVAPRRVGGQWVAAPNTVSATDVTKLIPRLELASKQGLPTARRKLVAALKQSHVLSARDATRLDHALGLDQAALQFSAPRLLRVEDLSSLSRTRLDQLTMCAKDFERHSLTREQFFATIHDGVCELYEVSSAGRVVWDYFHYNADCGTILEAGTTRLAPVAELQGCIAPHPHAPTAHSRALADDLSRAFARRPRR